MMLTSLFAAAILAQQPGAQPSRPAAGKYVLLRVTGDIDSDHYLRTVFAELDRARGVPLIVMELDGNSARPDLVAKLGARLATNSPPVAILLKDSADKRVGIGQALLGGFVKNCLIDPDTQVAAAPDNDLRFLAPAETKWETVEQEITGALWRKLTDLSADQALPQALITPANDTWAVPVTAGEPWKISTAAPAGGQAGPQPSQIIWGDGPRIEIDAATAVSLRLCTDKTESITPVLAASNLSPRSSAIKRTVQSGYPAAAGNIGRIVDDSKLAVRRIGLMLKLKSTPTVPTVDDHRRAGKSALDLIDRTSRELDKAEVMLSEFPELNRRREASASRTDKGPWRGQVDDLRKELDKHRTNAREFASR